MRDRRQEGILQPIGLTQCFRSLLFGYQPDSFDTERRVIGQYRREALLRLVQIYSIAVGHSQHADHLPTNLERHDDFSGCAARGEQHVMGTRGGTSPSERCGAVRPFQRGRTVHHDLLQNVARCRQIGATGRGGMRDSLEIARAAIAKVYLAYTDPQCSLQNTSDGLNSLVGATDVQRFRAKRGETIHLRRALPGLLCLVLCAIQQMRSNAARYKEREKHQPVERVRN